MSFNLHHFQREVLSDPICRDIWDMKYRMKNPDGSTDEQSIQDTHARVVEAIYAKDPDKKARADCFNMVSRGLLIPAGRVNAGAGTNRNVTLINCFVLQTVPDSMPGIQETIAHGALTMQQGGGIGVDFSTVRPAGALVNRTGSIASGIISFADQMDGMCSAIASAGARRGAMMLTLRDDHPDLWNPNHFDTHKDHTGKDVLTRPSFISAKRQSGRLTQFNVSVLVSNAFMEAVSNDRDWDLGFHIPPADGNVVETYNKAFPYDYYEMDNSFRRSDKPTIRKGEMKPFYVYRRVKARVIWEDIMKSTYRFSEPGVIFIDEVNHRNNLRYIEDIRCTNPCFTGDTKVWTVDGPKTFFELEGKEAQVLTQRKDGRLVYRTMRNIRKTRQNAALVEITLRRGGTRQRGEIQTLRCTPDHRFYLKHSLKEIKAADLMEGTGLASVYRGQANQHRKALFNGGQSILQHHIPFEDVEGLGSTFHVHHRDENKENDHPDNLELMPQAKHDALKMWGDRNPMRRFPEKNPFIREGFSAGSNNGRWRSDLDDAELVSMRASGMSFADIAEKKGCSKYTVRKRVLEAVPENHTVVGVRWLEEKEDVFCGTVDETNKFFVQLGDNDGVLTHNCGEQPLPPHGCCCLGSINTAFMIKKPFTKEATFDFDLFGDAAAIGVRMLDNVLTTTKFPLDWQQDESDSKRRIGLGITGWADALIQLGIRYDSNEAIELTHKVGKILQTESYMASASLARERGPFPLYDRDQIMASPNIRDLPDFVLRSIREYGLRNGVINTIAPNGTISLYVGNVSSGHEPVFSFNKTKRKVRQPDGTLKEYQVVDYAYRLYEAINGETPREKLPDYFVGAKDISPLAHIATHAAWQNHIDASISKTINVPTELPFEQFKELYDAAYDSGCKGCTTYREDPTSGRGSVLSDTEKKEEPVLIPEIVPPIVRPRARIMEGRTYKLKWPVTNENWYVTINNDGTVPVEVFITTKNVEHQEWVTALTRMVTAILRRGGNIQFLVTELSEVHSASGGAWIDRRYVPSVVAAIGRILEEEFASLGLLEQEVIASASDEAPEHPPISGKLCPSCHAPTWVKEAGCFHCLSCGHSNC